MFKLSTKQPLEKDVVEKRKELRTHKKKKRRKLKEYSNIKGKIEDFDFMDFFF
jgi:hypothetical protein